MPSAFGGPIATKHDFAIMGAFQKLKKRNKILYTIIVSTAIILYWRGVWGLADELLLASFPKTSYLISFILGIAILVIAGVALDKLT
ncbi:MAG: hypothetical protein ABH821_03180 [archaeon]